MSKILIFGATGNIGSNVALYLKNKGYDIVAVGHRESDNGFFATKEITYIGGVANENCWFESRPCGGKAHHGSGQGSFSDGDRREGIYGP